MSLDHSMVIATILLFFLILITRALPFLLGRELMSHPKIKTLEIYLPGMIMLLLVLYEIHIPQWGKFPYGINDIVALLLLTLLHLWRRNILLSIIVGTAVYIVMNFMLLKL